MNNNISRVGLAIRESIEDFFAHRLATGATRFFMEELRAYVAQRNLVAPGSPDRVMRDLRQRGVLDYQLISRSRSLYEVRSQVGSQPALWTCHQAGAPGELAGGEGPGGRLGT